MATRKVKFFTVFHLEDYDGGREATVLGDSVSEWLEVDEETYSDVYRELAKKHKQYVGYGSVRSTLVAISPIDFSKEDVKITKEKYDAARKKVAAEVAKKEAEKVKKKLLKQAATKAEKEKLFEQLAKELGK